FHPTLRVFAKAATLHDKSLYAQALQQVFADEFIKLGGKIVAQESAAKDATDIKPVLATIAAAGPELLYFPVFVSLGGNVVTQVRSVPGLEKVKLIASGSTFSPEFLKAGGPNSKGVYLSSPDFSAFTGDYAGLIKKHTAKYGGPTLSTYHAHAYDATNIMFTALAKVAVVDTDGSLHVGRQALRAAIFATKDFQGITGNLTCSPTGDCGAPVIAVYEIINADPASWNPAEGVNPKKIWP
ncbi:MAG: branched-chain amino acid ABC transporter substrate-binding protein, partial [Chloroflexi bacterium]|nr:branched-chain amino acid ABC transporter substrate-binding protein [Chloroflexota bacterium]